VPFHVSTQKKDDTYIENSDRIHVAEQI